MSWHFSRALEEEFLQACCSAGERSALWRSMPSAQDDSCSDRMKGTLHRFPSGTMYVPSTDASGVALLTSYRAAFLAKSTAAHLVDGAWLRISGRSTCGSWQMSLQGLSLPRTSHAKQLTPRPTTLSRWVSLPAAWSYPRRTWVLTMFGAGTGYLHTPTCTANYAAPSMQKWPSCREFVRVFGTPTPMNHEWLMGWPAGWTDSGPLETDKFRVWLQQHWQPSPQAFNEAA